MTLQTQIIEIPFSGKLDTKTAERLVDPGNFLRLENARLDRPGNVTMRRGRRSLGTLEFGGGNKTLGLISDNSTLGALTTSGLSLYNQAMKSWVEPKHTTSAFSKFGHTVLGVTRPLGLPIDKYDFVVDVQLAYANGILGVAFKGAVSDSTGALTYTGKVFLLDEKTRAVLYEYTMTTAMWSNKYELFACGRYIMFVTVIPDGADDSLYGVSFDTQSPTTAPATSYLGYDVRVGSVAHTADSYNVFSAVAYPAGYPTLDVAIPANAFLTLSRQYTDVGHTTSEWYIYLFDAAALAATPISGVFTSIGGDPEAPSGLTDVSCSLAVAGCGNIVATAQGTDGALTTRSVVMASEGFTVLEFTSGIYLGDHMCGVLEDPGFTGRTLRVLSAETSALAEYSFVTSTWTVSNWSKVLAGSGTGADSSNRTVRSLLYDNARPFNFFTGPEFPGASSTLFTMETFGALSRWTGGVGPTPEWAKVLKSYDDMMEYRSPAYPFISEEPSRGAACVRSDGKILVPGIVRGEQSMRYTPGAPGFAAVFNRGLVVTEIDPLPRGIPHVAFAGSLFFGGGYLQFIDSGLPVEVGWHINPVLTSVAHGAGGHFAAGTYGFKFLFSYTDALGRVWRSAMALPVSHAIALNDIVTGAGTGYRLAPLFTNKVRAELVAYRTVAGGTAYMLASPPIPLSTAAVTTDVLSIQGGTVDPNNTQLLAEPAEYISGGVLDNYTPPGGSALCVHGNRLAVAGSDDTSVFVSKEWVPSLGVEFNPGLLISTPAKGGPITALASLGGMLLIFKQSAIYQAYGDGPNDLGIGSYSVPQLITENVGAARQTAVVEAGGKVFFWGDQKGAWTVAPGGQPEYIGLPVEKYNALECASVVNVPKSNEVRFYLSSGDCLVFDYVLSTWGVHTNSGVVATVWSDVPVAATASGKVTIEDSDEHFDDVTPITMTAEFGWLKVGGLVGFQRVQQIYVLGDFAVGQKLKVELMHDYDDTVVQTISYAREAGEPAEVCIKPWTQKCQAIKIRVSNDGIQNRTAPISFDAIRLHVGVLPKKVLKASATK